MRNCSGTPVTLSHYAISSNRYNESRWKLAWTAILSFKHLQRPLKRLNLFGFGSQDLGNGFVEKHRLLRMRCISGLEELSVMFVDGEVPDAKYKC